MRSKLGNVALSCVLISLFALTLMILPMKVNASTLILYDTPSYYGVEQGGGGTHYEYSTDAQLGDHRAYCYGNAWATAMVTSRWTWGGSTLTHINIFVTIVGGNENRDYPGWGYAYTRVRAKLVDLTTSSVLFDSHEKQYYDGDFYQSYSFTATIQNGHTYQVSAGAYVETGYGLWGTPSALAEGTVDSIEITGDP